MFSLFEKPKKEQAVEQLEEDAPSRPSGLSAFISRNALPVVAALFALGLALTFAQMSHNQDVLVQRTALQHAAVYSHTLDRFRALYADEVVDTARGAGLQISHDYLTEKDTIAHRDRQLQYLRDAKARARRTRVSRPRAGAGRREPR